MSGGAPAADSSNNYTSSRATADFNPPNNDYGDSLLKLTPALTVSQCFTPTDQLNDDTQDRTSAPAARRCSPTCLPVVPSPICWSVAARTALFIVLNRDLLGGYDDSNAVQKIVNRIPDLCHRSILEQQILSRSSLSPRSKPIS